MPCSINIIVVSARDLPVVDPSSLPEASVEVRIGRDVKGTDRRRELSPKWEHKFDFYLVDTAVLYEAPIEFRVLDHDKVSKVDSFGIVRVDISNVLLSEGTTSIGGWFPIYDTQRGSRGSLFIKLKARFTRNENQFKQKDTAGVRFITSSDPTSVYRISKIFRFVEELVVESDPEHQGTESFRIVGESRRASRLTNEQRLNTLYRLSGKLQQQIALKVVSMGGNAVLGYTQEFDFECVGGIIARGYGTACKIKAKHAYDPLYSASVTTSSSSSFASTSNATEGNSTSNPSSSSGLTADYFAKHNNKPIRFMPPPIPNDVTILTIRKFSSVIPMRIGGIVSVRAVKLIKAGKVLKHRDKWWSEVRAEIKSHAIALSCNYITGYTENTSIHGDTCVVSASGTACSISIASFPTRPLLATTVTELTPTAKSPPSVTPDLSFSLSNSASSYDESLTASTSSLSLKKKEKKKRTKDKTDRKERERKHGEKKKKKNPTIPASKGKAALSSLQPKLKQPRRKSTKDLEPVCSYVHLPYKSSGGPFPMKTVLCAVCKKKYVPEMLLCTTEIPPGLPIVGKGSLVQAKVCLEKRTTQLGEVGASGISDMIPFLEYDLHRHLVFKLKFKGMNAIFGLKFQMSIGPNMVVGTATGTAVFISPLPPPPPFQSRVADGSFQAHIVKQAASNRDFFRGILDSNTDDKLGTQVRNSNEGVVISDREEDSANEDPLQSGTETAYVVEMDDEIDDNALRLLIDTAIPDGFFFCSTDSLPGCHNLTSNIQMIQMYTKARLPTPGNRECTAVFESVYAKLLHRLRGMHPCIIAGINLDVQQYDENEITLGLTAMAMLEKEEKLGQEEEVFTMEEDTPHHHHHHHHKSEYTVPKVTLTPLTVVPDSTTEYYYGRVNLHFIRETTVISNSDMGTLLHVFLAEVNGIVRANVAALGGNALLGYRLEEFILTKNQSQTYALVSISGDAVYVHYHCDSDGFKKLN